MSDKKTSTRKRAAVEAVEPATAIRIDMLRAVRMPVAEYIKFLNNAMQIKTLSDNEAASLTEKLGVGGTTKALVATQFANTARAEGREIFLDFGSSIEDFLPRSFRALEQNIAPSQRFVKLSDLVAQDNTRFVECCFAALQGAEPSQSSFDYYLPNIESGQISRLEMIIQLVSEARAAGTRVWFDFDLDLPGILELLQLRSPITGGGPLSGDIFEFDAASSLFQLGWYDLEHDNQTNFRWMSDCGLLRNPRPDNAVIRVELSIQHLYNTESPSMRCSLDGQELEIAVENGISCRYLVKAKVPEERGEIYGRRLKIEGLVSGCPANDLGSGDSRLISLAISGGSWVYSD